MKYKRKLYDADKINDFRELVKRYSDKYSDEIAFEYKESPSSKDHIKITYSQFASDIKSLGTALINTGLSKKKVAIISPNRYEWCVSYLAITTGNSEIDTVCNNVNIETIRHEDLNKIEEFIKDQYNNHTTLNIKQTNKYDRKVLTGKLAQLLDKLQ